MNELINKDAKTMAEGFNVSEERIEELIFNMKTAEHDWYKPTRSGEDVYKSDLDIVAEFVAFGNTESERMYLVFMAGKRAQSLIKSSRLQEL